MNGERRILVYGPDEKLLGAVFVSSARGHEAYSFQWDDEALSASTTDLIPDPEISKVRGRQFKPTPGPYGFLEDSCPDRWGRALIRRANQGRFLSEADYLLSVSDASRMGAFRFKEDPNGPFLGEGDVPPRRFLGALEQAAYGYDEFDGSESWKILLSPGSSLGGARPKVSIYDKGGGLFLAKFGHKGDEYDVPGVEYLTHLLALACGINVPEGRLVRMGSGRAAFLSKRFDRKDGRRIPYASFMCLLGAKDGDSGSHSYCQMAELLTSRSVHPEADLRELFRRVCFSLLAHNYDDHLRNHGMVRSGDGWVLSPCFDLNISPYPGTLSLRIYDSDAPQDMEELIRCAPYFRLSEIQARNIRDEMAKTIASSFDECAEKAGLGKPLATVLKKVIIL